MAKQKTFEDSMKDLESIVQELESKDLSLDEALKKFQLGMKLSKFCSKKLDESEKKVSKLIKDDGLVKSPQTDDTAESSK